MAWAASGPATSSVNSVPGSAASSKSSSQFLPSTDCASRASFTLLLNLAANSAKAAAGRMCSPFGLAIVTVRRRVSVIDGRPFSPAFFPSIVHQPSPGARLPRLRFPLQKLPHVLARLRLPKLLDELIIPHAPHDIFQCPQVVTRPVLRRDQEHQHVDRLPV